MTDQTLPEKSPIPTPTIQRHMNIRYLAFIVLIFVGFIAIVARLYTLQVVNHEQYATSAGSNRVKTIRLTGKRGMITDADSVVLAVSEDVYNLTFQMDSSQIHASDYKKLTKSILDTFDILADYNRDIDLTFVIERDPETTLWRFNFGSGVSDRVLEIRENQWRGNHYLTNLTKYETAEQCYNRLYEKYQMKELQLDEATALRVMAVYSEMQMNLYNSVPVVIAKDIPFAAVSAISGKSMMLPGMGIEVGEKRVYPRGNLASQIIGYTGAISEANNFATELRPLGYQLNDTIGKDGIELSMENWLTANVISRQGRRVMEKDSSGRLTRQLDYVAPVDGNNVKLTLIAAYQQEAERAIAMNVQATRKRQEEQMFNDRWLEANKDKLELRDFNEFPLQLADTGVMVVLDVHTGYPLAIAQHPTYDLNAMASGGPEAIEIMKDERNVLMNYAIQTRAEPGSIFKMVTALAALTNGKLSVTEMISDQGPFTKYTKNVLEAPTCWIAKGQLYKHANQTIIQGISNSCNYFFYELASRLYEGGNNLLYKYAAKMGLTTKTGIQLPGELRSVVGCQTSLYDPNVSIEEQETFQPLLVAASIKKHLRNIGSSYGITYDEMRLDKCVKQLMDMAIATPSDEWSDAMRPILMEELNMTRDMVWLQAVVGDIWVYLNDIKWGGSLEVQMAIGQSITLVTPAAVSRYVASLGNGGTVYNLSIIDSVVSPEGEILNQYQPSVFGYLEGAGEYIPYLKEGMKRVVDDGVGSAASYFRNWPYTDNIWAKTGTSQVTIGKIKLDLENNGWFVTLAPFEGETEIAVVTLIPNGYSGAMSTLAAREFLGWWFDNRVTKSDDGPVVPGNELMP